LEKILSPGRRIWHVVDAYQRHPFVVGPKVIVGKFTFLPAGVYERNGMMVERKKSLIQVYTDPGGRQTLAVADIRLKDPGRAKK
jgi:hypothetical protein